MSFFSRCTLATGPSIPSFRMDRKYATRSLDAIGFIGLGRMGSFMAKNVLKAGHPLIVCDVNASAIQLLKKEAGGQGAITVCSTPEEVAAKASTVMTMLPENEHVEKVYLDPKNGLFKGVQKNSFFIDSSTVSPALSQRLSREALSKSVEFIDAPVSGGVVGAENATLAFMVGGAVQSFDKAKPLLQLMGKNLVHCGAIGHGGIAKLCNNLLLAISMVGTCEVLSLGQRLGMDPALLTRVINSSSGRCWSSDTYNPVPGILPNVPASKDYVGGFSSKLMAKDLRLALDAASHAHANVFLGSLAHQLYTWLGAHPDFSQKDFSSLYSFLGQGELPSMQVKK